MTEHELIDYGVSTGWLTPEKAEQLKKDFPKIVRCKDCKNKEKDGISEGFHYCNINGLQVTDEWFCADGERKDETH